MEKFITRENIKIFKQRLEAPADEAQRQTLLKLLAQEEAKSQQLNEGHEPKKNEAERLTKQSQAVAVEHDEPGRAPKLI
jgi:hypothetical protein